MSRGYIGAAGSQSRTKGFSGLDRIPRILHTFWGGEEMPEEYQRYWEQWYELHPDWEFRHWTPELIPELRHQELYDHPESWSRKSNPWQWRSDLVRYEILYDQGGLYVDMDLEPLRPVDELLRGAWAVLGREDQKYAANGFLASVPGSDFLADILSGLEERAREMWDHRVNRSIGPHYVTDVLRRHPEVRVLPSEYLYPYHWSELNREGEDFAAQGAYTVHHWTVGR